MTAVEVIASQRLEANIDLIATFFHLCGNFTSVTVLVDKEKCGAILTNRFLSKIKIFQDFI